MHFKPFSLKQRVAAKWWALPDGKHYDAIVCDGSIRSGKTICMTVGFAIWSMCRFNNRSFAICGKTIESLRRNVILYMPQWLEGIFTVTERRSENCIIITGGGRSNRYFLFGGRDESSYALIQGMTLAGVLFDEVALMPRSFVEQALARCSVEGSRFWFNCNPENPNHWFYDEWVIDKEGKKNRLHLHFTMDDNPDLAPEVKQRYENMYSGVFYDRYIKGWWRAAEGRIYDMFSREKHSVEASPGPCTAFYISMDYGTQNPTAMLLWGKCGGVWYLLNEYYYSGRDKKLQKTDEEYYTELEKLAGDFPVRSVVIDPSAASMIATIRKHGRFSVRQADNSVLNGIRHTATALNNGTIKICRCCKNTLAEFDAYVWDEKAVQRGEDAPKKENDHAMDALRYFVMTVIATNTARVPKIYL